MMAKFFFFFFLPAKKLESFDSWGGNWCRNVVPVYSVFGKLQRTYYIILDFDQVLCIEFQHKLSPKCMKNVWVFYDSHNSKRYWESCMIDTLPLYKNLCCERRKKQASSPSRVWDPVFRETWTSFYFKQYIVLLYIHADIHMTFFGMFLFAAGSHFYESAEKKIVREICPPFSRRRKKCLQGLKLVETFWKTLIFSVPWCECIA